MAGNAIVTVNVSVLQAPTPSTLQQTGALISQGATTTATPGTPVTLTLLTQLSDLTAILTGVSPLLSLAWNSGIVTATTTAPHGLTMNDVIQMTIAGAVPAGYNGTYACTITGASTFTYPLASNPGTNTTAGNYTLEDVAELLAMVTTYFAQGQAQSVYVMELGAGTPAEGVATLSTWLSNNPQTVYAVLTPRTWDSDTAGRTAMLSLIASYEGPTGLFYLWITTTTSTYTNYLPVMKDVVALVEAPNLPAVEFSLAAEFYNMLSRRPSTTNRVPPFAFDFVYGVTAYPSVGNGALLTAFKNAGVNYIGNGAEGGVSQNIFLWGKTMDNRDILYWYSVDWTQINLKLDLTNEIINGANNPINPLYYDQFGINRIQSRAAGTMSRGITFGLAVGTVVQTELDQVDLQNALDQASFTAQAVVNAVPFTIYATQNPGDYKTGVYAGLTVIYIPQRGFEQIIVNLVVSDYVTF